MSCKWQALVTRCENLKAELPASMQDAFYQLVYYPVVGSAGVAQIYNYATLGDSLAIEALMKKDQQLTDYYNKQLASGKWDGIMLDNHIGYTQWSIPEKNVNPLALNLRKMNCPVSDTSDEYCIPAYKYSSKTDTPQASWIFLPDLGRGKGCMGASNVMAESVESETNASLSYEVDMKTSQVAIGILPTQDLLPERGLRLGVKIDDKPMQVIDARQWLHDEFGEYIAKNLAVSKVLKPLPKADKLLLSGWNKGRKMPRRDEVFDNIRWLSVNFDITPGKHTLKLIMIDPEITVEQIVINPDNNHYSYFGNGYFR